MKQDGCVVRVSLSYCQHDINKIPFPLPTPSNKCSCANATETNSTDLHAAVNNPTPVRTARRQDIWHCPWVDWEKRRSGWHFGGILNGRAVYDSGAIESPWIAAGPYKDKATVCAAATVLTFLIKGSIFTDFSLSISYALRNAIQLEKIRTH